MKISGQLNKNSITELYLENKRLAVPLIATIVSLILFFTFIVPQVFSFPARKTEIDSENEKLEKIKQAERIVSSINGEEIESQLKIILSTLPKDKPFEEALSSINTAAISSNTQIANYSFQDQFATNDEVSEKVPSLKFEVAIVGGIVQAVEFANQIYQTYPISEVESIKASNDISILSVKFYYKALPLDNSLDRTAIREISVKEIKLINDISKWNQATFEFIDNSGETASASANDGSPF